MLLVVSLFKASDGNSSPVARHSTPQAPGVVTVLAGLSDLLGPASQMVVVGQRDSEEEYATEEEEDGSIW